jgi:hypothetical protein
VSSVAADRLIRKRRGRLGPIHEAQRRHVVVVGSHADNHALAAVSARPRSAFTYMSTLSLASPASETRHPWRGCEDRAYICAYRSTDPRYIVLRKTTCSCDGSDKPVRTGMRRDPRSIHHITTKNMAFCSSQPHCTKVTLLT